ncbi:MAG: ribosome silencing factor [Clostridia bacterium]|nr:ribosome silencing factor [Clostridia bacterium]
MSCKNNAVNIAVKAADAKMGRDIAVLNIEELTTLTGYFVIVTGGSPSNIQAICDHIEDKMAEAGLKMLNKEGYNTAEWVLLGYEDVIIHIFQKEARDFYMLEHIWKDAKKVDIDDLLIEQ